MKNRKSTTAVLLYDKACPMCQGSVDWIKRRSLPNQFEFIPCNSPSRLLRFPEVTDDDCASAVQLILPDNRRFSGADAIPEILTRLSGWNWLSRILRLWPLDKLAPRVYHWVAVNRYFLSCVLFPSSKRG